MNANAEPAMIELTAERDAYKSAHGLAVKSLVARDCEIMELNGKLLMSQIELGKALARIAALQLENKR